MIQRLHKSETSRFTASFLAWAGVALAVVSCIVWVLLIRSDTDAELSTSEQRLLLSLAREKLISLSSEAEPVAVDPDALPEVLRRDGAAFVSLRIDDTLRGCMIDEFQPHEPLYANVLRNTQLAAVADDRFARIRQDEVERVRIEISVVYAISTLTLEDADDLLDRLVPGVDGVILRVGDDVSAYLPSVWEIFADPTDFLSQLCIKAGWDADRWRTEPYPTVQTYRVSTFSEPG